MLIAEEEDLQADPWSTISAMRPNVTHGQKHVMQPSSIGTNTNMINKRIATSDDYDKEEWSRAYNCRSRRCSRRGRWTTAEDPDTEELSPGGGIPSPTAAEAEAAHIGRTAGSTRLAWMDTWLRRRRWRRAKDCLESRRHTALFVDHNVIVSNDDSSRRHGFLNESREKSSLPSTMDIVSSFNTVWWDSFLFRKSDHPNVFRFQIQTGLKSIRIFYIA